MNPITPNLEPKPSMNRAASKKQFPISISRRWLQLVVLVLTISLAVVAAAVSQFQGRGSFAGSVVATPRGGSQAADIEIRAAGIVSHLGRSTVRIVGAADFGASVPTPLPPTDGVVTAANGDEVRFRIRWTLAPIGAGVFTVAGPYTITGGTGRFSNAGGEGFCTGRVDLNTGAAVADIAGTVVRQK